MKILRFYIARQVIGGTLLALLVLTALDVGFAFIAEIDDVGEGAYGWIQALMYTALTVPRRLYELFPTSVLIGALLSLGTVAENSELTAMRAAGVSVSRIITSALQAGVVLMLAAVLLGEVVAPASERQAQNMRTFSHSDQIQVGGVGLWARDGNDYLNVRVIMPGLRLHDLRVYRFDDEQRMTESIRISSARYQGGEWHMEGVVRSQVSVEGVEVEQSDTETWDRLLAPELFDVIVVEPRQMSAWTLARYIGYLRENNLESAPYELAFWTRFTTPLSSLVMLLLAIPFIFGSLRTGGAGQRLFIGILIGVGFHLLNRMLNHMGLVYGMPPLLAAVLPMAVFLVIALWAIRRVR
ncbi:LPS export ABC transporter permease LptG [Ectothiorhodospira variabilis]|uniref:LPS export ABC transporter permease LptG n=1 Tax=Ectothiorhodospira variabilis TaxID=505694 RepID=UPI001EFAE38F|nr:LPS export ABC transporter permease LptG [Ectothiorhodospira variabilis]MCG5495278.1 LPS export ABC transporter permease LptG [Ectothiorhodospira variabilis]MCG5497481.1 LPS export ABC transporter permease LptG [Ectothiorhodospira variabilis]MCG5504876.1 LPS export ABC transporter permease LptG [Ectothiorhodospira variabilis]MCG5508033.1 LPS export ABC transporter permease LptG [Ectothiorhodospira variabilis]